MRRSPLSVVVEEEPSFAADVKGAVCGLCGDSFPTVAEMKVSNRPASWSLQLKMLQLYVLTECKDQALLSRFPPVYVDRSSSRIFKMFYFICLKLNPGNVCQLIVQLSVFKGCNFESV